MKRIMFAKCLLVILVFQIGCTSSVERVDASQAALDHLTTRFQERDYVIADKSDIVNPHRDLGQQVGRMYQQLFRYPGSNGKGFFYGNALVASDAKRHEYIKGITKDILMGGRIEYMGDFLDQLRNSLSGYQ